MAEIKLIPLSGLRSNVADRSFPFEGQLGIKPVKLAGVLQFKTLRKGTPLPLQSISIRVRCYEKTAVNLMGVSQEATLWETTTMIWKSKEGEYEEYDAKSDEWHLEIPVEAAKHSPSAMQMRKWKVTWKLEAIIIHAPQPGAGDRLYHSYDLRLKNYSRLLSQHHDLNHGLLSPTCHSVDYSAQSGSWRADLGIMSENGATVFDPTDRIPVSLKLEWDSNLYEGVQVTLALVRQLEIRGKDSVLSSSSTSSIPTCQGCSCLATGGSPTPQLPPPHADLVDDRKIKRTSRAIRRRSLPPIDTLDSLNLESTAINATPSRMTGHATTASFKPCTCTSDGISTGKKDPSPAHVSRTTLAKSVLTARDMIWSSDNSCTMTTDLVSQRNEGAWSYGETVQTRLATLSYFVIASVKVVKSQQRSRYGRFIPSQVFSSSSSGGEEKCSGRERERERDGSPSDTILLPEVEVIVVPRRSSEIQLGFQSTTRTTTTTTTTRSRSRSTSSRQDPAPLSIPHPKTQKPSDVATTRSSNGVGVSSGSVSRSQTKLRPLTTNRPQTSPSLGKSASTNTLKAALGWGLNAGMYSLGHNSSLTLSVDSSTSTN